MNERIKELAVESGLYMNLNGNPYPVALTAEECNKAYGKFAELILTEVTDILATYRMKAIFLDGIEYNCQHPIYAIQKHFGVEQ
jgi:hypothetical protein